MSNQKTTNSLSSQTQPRPPKPKPQNPIDLALTTWLTQLPPELSSDLASLLPSLLSSAPKRWVVYPPIVLLPSGSFDASFWFHLPGIFGEYRALLWPLILKYVGQREGKGVLTHLGVNEGIPLLKGSHSVEKGGTENILRTPSGLTMLHGDFGPPLAPDVQPRESDFKEAFWVSCKQNGISQVWAPRYTMFSRGNIKEKARILDFHSKDDGRKLGKERLKESTAVDVYAGIGYFVFSYVAMGLRRVVGWELNPWSVEGLRRGAVANGWSIKIIQTDEEYHLDNLDETKIIIFLEDNTNSMQRFKSLNLGKEDVLHVNCGLLPSSQDSWKMALGLVNGEGWIHAHENVGLGDIQERRVEVEGLFGGWLRDSEGGGEVLGRDMSVEHVELVKSFAPGVWHCVFDVKIGELSVV